MSEHKQTSLAKRLAVKALMFLVGLAAVGIGVYLATRQGGLSLPAKKTAGQDQSSGQAVAESASALDRLAIPSTDFDFSVSPLEPFPVFTADIGPSLSPAVVSDIEVDDRFGYTGSLELTEPTVKVDQPQLPPAGSPSAAAEPDA